MTSPSIFRRNAAAVGLLGFALLNATSTLTMSATSGSSADRLAALTSPREVIAAVTFLLAQLPGIVGFLGLGHLLRRGAPRTATIGVCFAVLGAFGHTVFGGMTMVWIAMAQQSARQPSQSAAMAAVLDHLQNSPVMLFSLVGLGGTVVGLALLAVALWRAGAGPRWVPVVLVAFLLVEFVGTSMSVFASYLSTALLVIVFATLAAYVVRSPRGQWALPDSHVPLVGAAVSRIDNAASAS